MAYPLLIIRIHVLFFSLHRFNMCYYSYTCSTFYEKCDLTEMYEYSKLIFLYDIIANKNLQNFERNLNEEKKFINK